MTTTVHPEPTAAEIVEHHEYDAGDVQRVSFRKINYPLAIVEPDAGWATRFQAHRDAIIKALGPTIVSIEHVGSTSIPGLPAKDVIDIDLTVADLSDEDSYVPALEDAGFQFMLREPSWHGHRFFVAYRPNDCNLHVWGPGCPETIRHKLMRDWLREHKDDREAYAEIKRQSATETNAVGGNVMDYNFRKEGFIRELLDRIFKAKGYL
ncbi:hypothetical protein VHEMI05557 [[Torrubiella] hemipterigena]|uniref:GrpB domain protein n=1 Tax=[Torrubiella] hemipterigena TaxID=1531966 RepID=A0A0A1TJ36_9HYPO|nr:hypothetical protein VHEMI05557 [[Torrubiella] hemipterigena]